MSFKTTIETSLRLTALGALACALAVGCAQPAGDGGESGGEAAGGGGAEGTQAEAEAPALRAEARMNPTEGNETTGVVTFEEVEGGVRVVANLQNLAEGLHGFHVHEFGDCSAPDGTSAGGHFSPDGSPHAGPDMPAGKRHVGDLGNIEAGADGTATADFVDPVLSLSGPHSILGKGLIVHADPDDLTSQPTGAAGARLACGVIEAVEGGS